MVRGITRQIRPCAVGRPESVSLRSGPAPVPQLPLATGPDRKPRLVCESAAAHGWLDSMICGPGR
jgi:hypothetical protein